MPEWRNMQGVTLLELIVVLVIGAILTTMAVPSFQSTIKRNRVQTHVHDLAAALKVTRSEAVARVETVSICGSSDQATCNDSSDWSAGWIVFVDDGAGSGGVEGDGELNGTEEIIKAYRYQGTNSLIVNNSAGGDLEAVTFSSRGFVSQNVSATLRICEEGDDVNFARALLLERTGRVSLSYDLYNSSGTSGADGIYEDVNGDNLTCS